MNELKINKQCSRPASRHVENEVFPNAQLFIFTVVEH